MVGVSVEVFLASKIVTNENGRSGAWCYAEEA